MRRFGFGILAGLGAVLGGLLSAYGAVATFAPESLPAPALGNLVHIDEKLRFLRRHPDFDPTVLAVGSSVTWRQVAGAAFEDVAGGPKRFLNGATAYLRAHQTRALTEFYLDHYKSVRTVLVMTGLPDFGDCTSEPAVLLDLDAAAKYAFRRWPAVYFYLSYFAPQRYLRTALSLAEEKKPYIGPLFLDPYGSSPLQVPKDMQRGLRYGSIEPDPACLTALIKLNVDLMARGVRLMVVLPPVHPEYRRLHPEAMAWMREIARTLSDAALATGNMTVLALHDDPEFSKADFFDAFHLQWEAVQRLSRRIARDMKLPRPNIIREVEKLSGTAVGRNGTAEPPKPVIRPAAAGGP